MEILKKNLLILIKSIGSTLYIVTLGTEGPVNRHVTFTSPTFGRTHFIVGYPYDNPLPTRTTHQEHTGGVYQVLFAPDDNIQHTLLGYIQEEQHRIQAAIYLLTDKEIAIALCEAHKRGVGVEIIIDQATVQHRGISLSLLRKEKIPLYVYQPVGQNGYLNDIMHHKFVIFSQTQGGKGLVWTGSCNFTKSAKECNQENVVILDSTKALQEFAKQFDLIKRRSVLMRS